MSILKVGQTYQIKPGHKVTVFKVDSRLAVLRKFGKDGSFSDGIYFTDTEAYLKAFHQGRVLQMSVNGNRYNDSRQGANADKSEMEKAWIRWSTGRIFDSSDESFYNA
jgi:hypothetical protein